MVAGGGVLGGVVEKGASGGAAVGQEKAEGPMEDFGCKNCVEEEYVVPMREFHVRISSAGP